MHKHWNSARRRSRLVAVTGALATVVAMASLMATSAMANLTGSSFEGNDGDLLVTTAGNTDWANVAGLNTGIDKPSGSTDNSFGQGTKEDSALVKVVTGSIPPNKNDLSRFYEASEMGSNGHMYLYLAWERLVNIGNANLDFEINQSTTAGFTATTTGPVTLARTAGDILVTYDFGGSGTPTLGLNTWLTAGNGDRVSDCYSANSLPCWGDHTDLTGDAEGAVNSGTVSDPLQTPAADLTTGLFGEAAVDLTAAGVFPEGACKAFGSTFVKSRSSSSFTAELKDFIAPIPVSISNCGTIVVNKVTENGDSSFGYTTTGSLDPATFSLGNGDSQTWTDLQPGSYSVTESLTAAQTAAGWTLKDLSCDDTGTGTSSSVTSATANITLGLGGTVECTYTNHTKLSPDIGTTLSDTSVDVGSTVHDSATLTGATATAGGTVTYTVYTDDQCTTGARDAGTKPVTDGVVDDSDALVFDTAGDYYWQAVYSGDSDNNGATSLCTDEHLVVNKLQPAVSTAQTLLPNDSFTLSGATATAGGTITFNLYSPSDSTCTGTPAYSKVVDVSGNDTYSTDNTAFLASTEGTWRWESTYSGDANNESVTSTCGTEHFTIAN